jgi:hypothetical protein
LTIVVQPDIQRFNQAVQNYNEAIDLFPASWMARALKFTSGRPLE